MTKINYISDVRKLDNSLWLPIIYTNFNCRGIYCLKIINDATGNGWMHRKYPLAEKISKYYGKNFYKKYTIMAPND